MLTTEVKMINIESHSHDEKKTCLRRSISS
jgi:hypothetical protein